MLSPGGPSLVHLCFKLIPIYAQQEIRVISNAGLGNIDAPVYSLPDEILALIFEEKLEMVFTRDEIDKRLPFEVVVSHINRRWRKVAIDLGSLWCTIRCSFISPFDMLDVYLARSKGRLLDIELAMDQLQFPPGPRAVKHEREKLAFCLSKLTVHVDRWHEFTATSNSHAIIQIIIDEFHILSAPNLVYLAISLAEQSYFRLVDVYEHLTPIFLGGAPRLSYFKCYSVTLEDCWPPMGALTDLVLGYSEVAQLPPLTSYLFHRLLTHNLPLTNIQLVGCVVDVQNNILPIELPHLISLDVDIGMELDLAIDEIYTHKIFSAISAPALTSLTLSGASDGPINAFTSALQNSRQLPKYPALTHLKFFYGDCNRISRELVDTLPSIVHLSLIQCSNTIYMLASLSSCDSEVEDTPIPWPKLQTITVDHCDFAIEWIPSLRGLVNARNGCGHPLKSITVRLRRRDDDSEMLFREAQAEALGYNVQLESI
jgi:hypothetical protein